MEMKDKILIAVVLVIYFGASTLTSGITNIAETMWKQIATVASTLSSPYGIFFLVAGICVVLYIVGLKTLKKRKRRLTDEA